MNYATLYGTDDPKKDAALIPQMNAAAPGPAGGGQAADQAAVLKDSTSPQAVDPRQSTVPGATPMRQTFAQMQASGMARPAPPSMTPPAGGPLPGAPAGGSYGGYSGGGGAINSELSRFASESLRTPSGFDDAAMKSAFDRMAMGIDDDFNQRETGVNEEMARRGFYDSTLAGGRLWDTNVGRRSAKVDLGERLATERARAYSTDRSAAFAQALGLQRQQSDDSFRGAELGEKGRQFDAGYGLDVFDRGEKRREYDADYGLKAYDRGEDAFRNDRNFTEDGRQFDEKLGYDRDALSQDGMFKFLNGLNDTDVTDYGY